MGWWAEMAKDFGVPVVSSLARWQIHLYILVGFVGLSTIDEA